MYGLRSDSAEFDLDSVTGELRTLRSLDREQQSVYVLSTCAYDVNRPVLHHCVNVTVSIEDVNDNRPVVFDVRSRSLRYHFNVKVNGTLTQNIYLRRLETQLTLGLQA